MARWGGGFGGRLLPFRLPALDECGAKLLLDFCQVRWVPRSPGAYAPGSMTLEIGMSSAGGSSSSCNTSRVSIGAAAASGSSRWPARSNASIPLSRAARATAAGPADGRCCGRCRDHHPRCAAAFPSRRIVAALAQSVAALNWSKAA